MSPEANTPSICSFCDEWPSPEGCEPFIATICENPGEDGPRLVYADWLEEFGETVHAEFIRNQLELHRVQMQREELGKTPIPQRGTRWQRQYFSLVEKQGELEKASRPHGTPIRGGVAIIRRGFIDELVMSWEAFNQDADEVIWHPSQRRPCPSFAQPIRKVKLTTPVQVKFSNSPLLFPSGKQACRLSLDGNPETFETTEVSRAASGELQFDNSVSMRLLAKKWPGVEFKHEPQAAE